MGCVCSPEPPLAGERASNQRSDMAQPLIPTTTTSGKTGSQDAHSSSSHQESSLLHEIVQPMIQPQLPVAKLDQKMIPHPFHLMYCLQYCFGVGAR